jgi:hypothetical protein
VTTDTGEGSVRWSPISARNGHGHGGIGDALALSKKSIWLLPLVALFESTRSRRVDVTDVTSADQCLTHATTSSTKMHSGAASELWIRRGQKLMRSKARNVDGAGTFSEVRRSRVTSIASFGSRTVWITYSPKLNVADEDCLRLPEQQRERTDGERHEVRGAVDATTVACTASSFVASRSKPSNCRESACGTAVARVQGMTKKSPRFVRFGSFGSLLIAGGGALSLLAREVALVPTDPGLPPPLTDGGAADAASPQPGSDAAMDPDGASAADAAALDSAQSGPLDAAPPVRLRACRTTLVALEHAPAGVVPTRAQIIIVREEVQRAAVAPHE